MLQALRQVEVPANAVTDPDLRGYRGESLATMDTATRENIERCRSLGDFGFDLDAAERIWDEAMTLPAAAVLDFGGLSVGDPTVDLVVAWEILDPPARDVLRRRLGVEDAAWLTGRAWALRPTPATAGRHGGDAAGCHSGRSWGSCSPAASP